MAIHIQIGKNNIDCKIKANMHYLPCKIHADCDAKVKQYFETFIREGADNVLLSSFRGRPLKGAKISMPEGYKGIVLHESIRPSTDKEERKFYVIHEFDSLTYWNWDKVPSKNDAIRKALDWIDIAEALHSPVEEE